jgi:hypothetical protein
VLWHLNHADTVDWVPRLEIILKYGTSRPFERFDREEQPEEPYSMDVLLTAFAGVRQGSLDRLREIDLREQHLELQGMHPDLGVVTVRQLLATWTAHDLAHVLQVSRVMAKRLKGEVGPWAQYLSVMK